MRGSLLACTSVIAAAQDPANGWMAYAVGAIPSQFERITRLEMTWTVGEAAKRSSAFYSPWFGMDPADNLNLVQPVNPWGGSSWSMYTEYYQWSPSHNSNSRSYAVQPGQNLHGSIVYDASSDSYELTQTIVETGKTSSQTVKCQSGKKYVIPYVVYEKEWTCKDYPPDGKVAFRNIVVECDGQDCTQEVKWQAKVKDSNCDMAAHVDQSAKATEENEISITWNPAAASKFDGFSAEELIRHNADGWGARYAERALARLDAERQQRASLTASLQELRNADGWGARFAEQTLARLNAEAKPAPVGDHGQVFLEGFLSGFIGEATHIKKCIAQSEQTIKDAAALMADVKAHKFNQTVNDIEALVQDVGAELPSCKGASKDLKPILEAFKGVHSIKDLTEKLKTNFLAHDRDILDIIVDEVQVCGWGEPDAHKCGADIGKQVRSLVIGDQFSSPMVTGHGKIFMEGFIEGFIGKAEHIKACVAQSVKTEDALVKFISDVKSHKFNQTISDIQELIADAAEDLSTCKGAGKDLAPILAAFKDVHSLKDMMHKLKENFLAHDKEFLDILDDMIEVCTFGAPDAHKCGEDLGRQTRSLVIGDQFAVLV